VVVPVKTINLNDRSRPSWANADESRPMRTTIWEPTAEGPCGAILLSHGTGGAAEDLGWLAEPLNQAGFLVAAVDHHGNSYADEYLVEGFAFPWERPRDLSLLLDHLEVAYDVDKFRIGAAGFSLGGYTVAALLGAMVEPRAARAVFSGIVPAPEVSEFPDLVATLRAAYSDAQLETIITAAATTHADSRIRAGFLMAPAVGQLLDPTSLATISAPLEVRWGDADDIAPPEVNAALYVSGIPAASGMSLGQDVGHYIFLGDRPDPSHARNRTAADAVSFFRSALPSVTL
jgi:predicted dienelactone hydrolase